MPSPKAHEILHGKSLENLLEDLVEEYGWEKLSEEIPIRCFSHEPSVSSSLKFLRKTPWARKKVEIFYIRHIKKQYKDGLDKK